MPETSAWVTVASSYFLPEADVIRSVLEEHGIPVFLRGEHTAGLAPPLSMLDRGIRIQVHRDDEARALHVLKDQTWDDEAEEWDDETPLDERLDVASEPASHHSSRAVAWALVTGMALAWIVFSVFFSGGRD